MLEFGVRKPSRANRGRRHLWNRASEGHRVAFAAGFSPQELLGIGDTKRDPFRCVAGRRNGRAKDPRVGGVRQADFFGVRGDVFRELIGHVIDYDLRFFVRCGIGETFVEQQRMTGSAVFLIIDRRYRRVGASVAIGALQLHYTVRTAQVFLEMNFVAEFDGAGIGSSECCEFGMRRFEARDSWLVSQI